MSVEDLEAAGLLLPRDQWGAPPRRPPFRVPTLVLGVLAALSGGLMSWGDGRASTWIGLGLFFAVLAGFTVFSLAAIENSET
jgi:hypothetical protein